MVKAAHVFAGLAVMLSSTQLAVAVSDPTWLERLDVASILICALFSIVTFFALRTLKQIDQNQHDISENQKDIFERISKVETNFAQLRGEHEARKDICHYPRGEA